VEDRKTWREDERGETYEASVSDEEVSFFHSSANLELWERGAVPLERYFEAQPMDGSDRTVRELIADMGPTRDEVDHEVRRRLEDPERDARMGRTVAPPPPVVAGSTAVVAACPRAAAAGAGAGVAQSVEVRFAHIAKVTIGGSILCVSGLMLVDPAPTPGWEGVVKLVALLALTLTPTLIHEW
jgi:hypothetical protein